MEANHPPVRPRRSFLGVFLFIALAGTLVLWFFRGPLQNRITAAGILANDSPPPELVEEMILQAGDPRAALLAAWNSGKIVQREMAIRCLSEVIPTGQPLPPPFDALMLSATLDPDMDVRETAFGLLRERKDSRLAALASAQLHDPDHFVRLLGLHQFKYASAAVGVPTVIPLLDDADPLVVTTSLHLLESWSGENFGVKFSDVASLDEAPSVTDRARAASEEKLDAGVQRAKAWWAQHQSEFPPVHLVVPEVAYSARRTVPAGDFELRTLDGKKIRLSDFRGRVVLINFWTTWCTACVGEIPELIALQKKYQGKLVILGVSLDAIPDDEGQIGGEVAAGAPNQNEAEPAGDKPTTAQLKRIHDKVVRTVKARGINYPVLLDEQNEVGGRFNGGELPTTVIVDALGNVRRRFIGPRSLPEFEAMLAEAGLRDEALASGHRFYRVVAGN